MSEIKRAAGDKLRLRAALTGGETDLFVRASLFDAVGTPLTPPTATLPHLAKGTYGENLLNMPNIPHVFVRTEVFLDAGFTTPAPRYRDLGLDIYSLEGEELPPTITTAGAYGVKVMVGQKDVHAKVGEKPAIKAVVSDDDITAKVDDDAVKANLKNKNEIEGVLND